MKRQLFSPFISFIFMLGIYLPTSHSAGSESVVGALSVNESPSPNIILIVADDLGYGDLSCYGNDFGSFDLQTPQIDSLAHRGMKFTHFRANSCVCSPTRAAIMTGMFPDRAGVPGVIRTHPDDSWGYLDPKVEILPVLLGKMGYRTAHIGKWHLGLTSPNTPNERGFDFFHGFLGDMMDDYWTHRRHDINYMRLNEEVIDPSGHATDLFTQWTIDYLRDYAQLKAENHNDTKPFFLYLCYNAPHTPIQPPAEYLDRVYARDKEIDSKRAEYIALVEHLDDSVGKILDTLRECQPGETIIIFTGDNGGQLDAGAFNGPKRAGKGTVYEGGLSVPAIVYWPGVTESGSRNDSPLVSMDIFPTILAMTGRSIPPFPQSIDGIDFSPILRGETTSLPSRDLYFIRREGGVGYRGLTIDALESNRRKLLQNSPFSPLEMYDMANDPLETNNLCGTNQNEFRRLLHLLMKQTQQGGQTPWFPPGRPITSSDQFSPRTTQNSARKSHKRLYLFFVRC